MVLGLVIYLVPPNTPPAGKLNEVGRLAFFAGLLAFLMSHRG